MAFYGSSFMYDGTPSEIYGLRIADIDASGISQSMGNSSMDIIEQKIYRRATPFFFGSTPAPKLEFEFKAYAEKEIDADTFQLIQKWLFSSRTYKRFQIDQFDMTNVYFNVILQDPQIVRAGNLIQGFSCNVTCDSPFAWTFPKTITWSFTDPSVNSTKLFNNTSDDTGNYLYPNLVITMNNLGGNISIINQDDNNRAFTFTDMQANEVLTINCSNQTILSSTGLKRLSHFNKKYLRLIPNINHLNIVGNVSSSAMTTQFVAKKISG